MLNPSQHKLQLASGKWAVLAGDIFPSWCLPIDPANGEYFLPHGEFKLLQRRAHKAQREDQGEVAGMVLAVNSRLLSLLFLHNCGKGGSFAFEESEIRNARKRARKLQQRVIGTFHSHPISAAIPSPGDLRGARLNSVNLIYDVCGRTARLWRISMKRRRKIAKEIKLVIKFQSDLSP
jgi:proteasome lid subunit RPN8/RPN11